jgi:RNA polymerase sigma-70 factor (ECF subfamily)
MSLLRLPRPRRRALLHWRILLFAAEAKTPDEPSALSGADAAAHALEDFEPFFEGHEREVVGYLWRITGEEQAARDLTQETFLRAWQRFERVRVYDQPKAWLFRVATHLALNFLRDQAAGVKARQAWGRTESTTQSDPAIHIVNQDEVLRTLLTLSPRDRAALVLHTVYGLSCAELAQSLGISRSAAKATLWRARERFRAQHQRLGEPS